MRSRLATAMGLPLALALGTISPSATWAAITEYSQHFNALRKLSVAVAEAMPPEQYTFRPDPGSMTFGELMWPITAAKPKSTSATKALNRPLT